ncbi:MAG: HupE/UreJ family protein [Chromatiales bacterium]|nr:HupE/UreJ family protein [Chromatiales bacterium]
MTILDRRFGRLATILFVILLEPPSIASAHDGRPLVIGLDQTDIGHYIASVYAPPTVAFESLPTVYFPSGCEQQNSRNNGFVSIRAGSTQTIFCPGGLSQRQLEVDYPLGNPSLSTLLRITWSVGDSATVLSEPGRNIVTVPLRPTTSTVSLEFLKFGITHVLAGVDHLAFVICLLFLCRTIKHCLIAVTGFTAAHSITLTLAALGYIGVPIRFVEILITLSVAILAAEVLRSRRTPTLPRRHPFWLASAFGLLHGLGFASALGEAGLPRFATVQALLSFNIGVELGQALVIVLALSIAYSLRSLPAVVRNTAGVTSVYVVGVTAAYWSYSQIGLG